LAHDIGPIISTLNFRFPGQEAPQPDPPEQPIEPPQPSPTPAPKPPRRPSRSSFWDNLSQFFRRVFRS
jgi:hypothetical protein